MVSEILEGGVPFALAEQARKDALEVVEGIVVES